MTELTATPAATWRRAGQEGELYTLPGSGNTIRLKRISLFALAARTGNVPNPLAHEVLRLEGVSRAPKTEAEQIANYREYSQGHVEVAKLCAVEPRIVDEPNYDAGEIGPSDLAEFDYAWIYNVFIKGVADDRNKFRAERVADEQRSITERLAARAANDTGTDAG